MTSKLAKAMDDAISGLSKAISFDDTLAKASHDAMAHHAVHARAAEQAGKHEESKQHKFMQLRHSLESARGKKTSGDMEGSMRRNMEHYGNEASGEVGYGWASSDNSKDHPAVKHFKAGGAFKPHAHDSQFKEDYAGKKNGPKTK